MMFQTVQTTGQVHRVEDANTARNVAMMGVVYHQKTLVKEQANWQTIIFENRDNPEQLSQRMQTFNNGIIQPKMHVKESTSSFFTVENVQTTIDGSMVQIQFDAVGHYNNVRATEQGILEIEIQ